MSLVPFRGKFQLRAIFFCACQVNIDACACRWRKKNCGGEMTIPEPLCLGACLYYWQQLLFRNSSRGVVQSGVGNCLNPEPLCLCLYLKTSTSYWILQFHTYKWQQCESEMFLHTFRGAKRIHAACYTVLCMPCLGLFALMELIMCRIVISLVFLLSLWFNDMIVAVGTRSEWYMWFLAKPIWAANSPWDYYRL
jgi:hypothetical protein